MASPPHQPKKLKMSSTTTASDEEPDSASAGTTTTPSEPKRRYKRRKIAIFLAYCGAGYQGMQKNPGAKTIESDLEEALFLSGAVPEPDRGCPKRFDWARSARTDKGVSAVGQVVSGRFYVDPPGFVDRLSDNLSPQIRIFGFKRATASFNAKKFCDRRRYVYLLPVFALDPNSHPDRESVVASLGSGNELARCFECSERGRKVVGLMGRQSRVSKEEEQSELGVSCLSSVSASETGNGEFEMGENVEGVVEEGKAEIGSSESQPCDSKVIATDSNADSAVDIQFTEAVNEDLKDEEKSISEARFPKEEAKKAPTLVKCSNGEQMVGSASEFCYGDKERERFNGVLKQYVGTHNFHNFTTRTKAEDPSAQRYIVSFDADRVVNIEGIEFVRCEVLGQSFMLHQIRKMIGLAVAIMRNCAPESLLDTALRKDININVPTAPEVGLYLDECFFTSYNNKWKDSHEELSMEAYVEQAEEFKMKHIYSHIASMELKEGAVALWLHSLNHRNYPDLCPSESNGECVSAEHPQVDNLTA